MNKRVYEMKMPAKYVELTAEEMEYDGGAWNFVAAVFCSAMSFGFSIAAEVTGDKNLEYWATGFAAASFVLSFGATSLVAGYGKKLVGKRIAKVASRIFNPKNVSAEEYKAFGMATAAISAPTDLGGWALTLF